MSQLIAIRDAILDALTDEQKKRRRRKGTWWIAAERAVMLRETNAWRAKLGGPPVDVTAIERVEMMACGHSDYSSKFALYCAEIALGTKEPRP